VNYICIPSSTHFHKLKVLLLLSGAVYCGNMDNERQFMESGGSVSHVDPSYTHSLMSKHGCSVSEECIEYDDDDSEDDYASIQRPAFQVDGEPNFDSGPPEDGWEYLRRVRYCCNCQLPIAGPLVNLFFKILFSS